MKRSRIVIFAKAPVPGRVKTRLEPALGPNGAALLAEQMLKDTLREAQSAAVADVELCAEPPPAHADWQGCLPRQEVRLTAQQGADLGERLAEAAERVLAEGWNVILIGTDCPALTASRLRGACRDLEDHDAVIHPTFDGGYALLGLARFDASIFEGIGWSGPRVAKDTMARIRALGWRLHLGETLHDIDEPEDLERLRPDSGFLNGTGSGSASGG